MRDVFFLSHLIKANKNKQKDQEGLKGAVTAKKP